MKQPFQCNLQPEIQEPHGTTHTGTTTRCKTHRRNNSRTKRPQPQPPHRRGSYGNLLLMIDAYLCYSCKEETLILRKFEHQVTLWLSNIAMGNHHF